MQIGVFANLVTDTLPITALARALEGRSIESLFVGEHTHTPVASEPDGYHTEEIISATRDSPAPFVLLAAAAAVTERLRIGTSVCLPGQHDPLLFAKEVATLDQVSNGRVLLGCGYGWNKAEMVNHGVDPKRRRSNFRERIRAVRALWTEDVAEFTGEFVSFSASWSLPKPAQRPGPQLFIGAPARQQTFEDIIELANGWMPAARAGDEGLEQELHQLRRAIDEAGRPQKQFFVTMIDSRAGLEPYAPASFFDRCVSVDQLRRWRDMEVDRVVIGIPTPNSEAVLPILDHVEQLMRSVS